MTRSSNAATVISLRHGNTKATTEPKHLYCSHNTQYTVTNGLPGQPIVNRQCLRRPALTSPWAERHHLSREPPHRHPACYHRCHTILQVIRQPRPLSPLPCVEGVVPPRHTQQGLRRFARELSCSVDLTARSSGALLSWSCVATERYCRCARRQVTPQNTAT
ncbi:hypothetical protein BU23DRAFT_127268 [Bimuria novae-zelandiae CBS 107.79]|uniref:Uncharacterized protein n=1 Tax=Bimuria novae-zelandiae CBS 107.79 TaxID=1447943 RepID=A0A6A5VA05_9PLEO|nr:hypothetical protein BU23DRAFT_127268 [Bimuria novae-zelandiae CBS 107.79]